MAITYYADLIILEIKKRHPNIKKIYEYTKNLIKSQFFLQFLLNDFLDFN